VIEALAIENRTAVSVTNRNVTIPANGVLVITRGGTESVILAAVRRHATVGITVSYLAAVAVPIRVQLTTTAQAGFPTDGLERIRSSLVEAVSELDIGSGLVANALFPAAYAIPGHVVSSLTVDRMGSSDGVDTTDLDRNEYLTLSAENATVTVTS